MSATSAAPSRQQRLANLARVLDDGELDVLLLVAAGMATGRTMFGPLVPAADRRDFVAETLEEVRDALVYVGAQLVRVQHARGA